MRGELIKELDRLHQENQHEEIIKTISKLPKEEINSEILGKLARAHSNLEKFVEALEILKSIQK